MIKEIAMTLVCYLPQKNQWTLTTLTLMTFKDKEITVNNIPRWKNKG
jgi:hypothetical protein